MLRNRFIKKLSLGEMGLNLWTAIEDLKPGEALRASNCFWRRGMQMKLGSAKHSTNEVVASKTILGLHRFYYDTSSEILVAVCDTVASKMNDGTGVWTNIKTGLTTALPNYMTTWGALNKMYSANGTDDAWNWDATTAVNMTGDTSASGTQTSATANKLTDTGANFGNEAEPTVVGMWVHNTTDDLWAKITAIDSTTVLSLDTDIFGATEAYVISSCHDLPDKTLMFLPYRDRLLSIDRTNPSYVQWSHSYDDRRWITSAQAIRIPGPGSIEGIFNHSLSDTDTGIDAMVLVIKPTSLYLVSGTDLDPASSGFNVRIDPVGGMEGVGCISPRTVVSTPKGTIFLGTDRRMYMIPFGTFRAVPIGHKIYSGDTTVLGTESIPLAQLSKACAVYHDGFYKISIAKTSGTANSNQYWLDIDRLYFDDKGYAGPWYGPMTGMAIANFVVQGGAGDNGKLLGGEAGANGYVYDLNVVSTFTDNGSAIAMTFRTGHEALAGPGNDVRIMQSEVESTAPANSVAIRFYDTHSAISTATSLSISQPGTLWDTANWDDFVWEGSADTPIRSRVQYYDKFVTGRLIATQVAYSSSTDTFKIFSVVHEGKPINQTFQVRT